VAEDEKTIASPAPDPRRGEHLLLGRRIGARSMDEGTLKDTNSKCRLYWSFFCLGCCSNFVGSESDQKQSVKLLQNMVWSILKKRRHLGFGVFIFHSSMIGGTRRPRKDRLIDAQVLSVTDR
jgi:hypothetical protein